MKVLLINPNRYKFPPAPPIGLEYLAACLEQKGHTAEILDLCFSENIYEEINDNHKAVVLSIMLPFSGLVLFIIGFTVFQKYRYK